MRLRLGWEVHRSPTRWGSEGTKSAGTHRLLRNGFASFGRPSRHISSPRRKSGCRPLEEINAVWVPDTAWCSFAASLRPGRLINRAPVRAPGCRFFHQGHADFPGGGEISARPENGEPTATPDADRAAERDHSLRHPLPRGPKLRPASTRRKLEAQFMRVGETASAWNGVIRFGRRRFSET